MSFEVWMTFVFASTVLVIIPGPTVLLVLSYALARGRQVAITTALGVALGDLIAMSASLLGLGALIMASSAAFLTLKWIGAAYLVYLGIKMLRAPAKSDAANEARPGADTQAQNAFWHAAMVTALNPKSIGFFIAFVPQFLRPEHALAPQFMILIATFVMIGAGNALLYALLAGTMRGALKRPRVLTALSRFGGATLIAMGVFTATLKRA
ncbi:MAG: LysE family translocator [Maritimibacter sp.]